MNGQTTLFRSRIQIDIWSKKSQETVNVDAAIRKSLTALRGTINDTLIYGVFLERVADFYEVDSEIFRISTDYFFNYKE